MIFRIDEDGVIRAGGHARFATNADRFVEIDDAISAFEHRRSRAGGDAGGMCALIATSHLMRSPCLRKHANVDVLDVSARDGKGHEILRLAGGRAGMAAMPRGLSITLAHFTG